MSAAMATAAGATYAGAALPARRAASRSNTSSRASTLRVHAAKKEEEFDARQFRRDLSKTDQYNRKFAKDEESAKAMEDAGIGMVSRGAYSSSPHRPHARDGRLVEEKK